MNPIDKLKGQSDGGIDMYHPIMTIESDNTEIVCLPNMDLKGNLVIAIETPVYNGFKSAKFLIPVFEWKEIKGYTESEIEWYSDLLKNISDDIIEMVKGGV